MTTLAKMQPAGSAIHRRHSRLSTTSSLPEYEVGDYVQLQALSATASQSESSSLPDYDALSTSPSTSSAAAAASAVTAFRHTTAFQIETAGHPLFHLPLPPRPVPIPVLRVSADGALGDLAYESLRARRGSGSCTLVRGGDGAEAPVCSTSYRFGPGKNPQLRLHGRLADPAEVYEVQGKGIATRAQAVRTHLGTFEWRYAGRADRRALGASSLLLLERVTVVALAGGKKKEERRVVVGMFVRSAELRTQGTSGCTAGNGGRLLLNLAEWADEKLAHEQMEILAIASCIVMLKKEIDRRRVQQCMMMSGGGGGP
ncbi:hypothetical protein ISF_06252 [Cordyceps fumosorosea ARSEF 2679]|uniref:Uncharacterized protein n=1 Tax=Cordyceps fumosorosea (strain ARSEF 2679) TaxID=1081104 RepID=A0A167S6V0_CORFA|nr:hypothetical protein ISF_06252 [Cordyceps fumosorosea ARSEF 2679]OAA59317.1 hypothetical protein ISF_06252 [Cordyceps fumosorosea ARSEF 2679]